MTELVALTAAEDARLAELEQSVERGLATFVEVGQALLEIRDSRLYRATHPTFEAYCTERWDISRSRGYRLIEAAETAGALSPMGDIPANERQARELAPLRDRPEEMAAAFEEAQAAAAAEGRPATAADVRDAVQSRMGVHYSSATAEWSTPQDVFDALDTEFGFDLDVCATAENAKAARFFTVEQDGLGQDWEGTCWMNPPYGDAIAEWVKKAWESAEAGAATVVCLVPARTDTGWWWNYCRHGEIRFVRGRLRFGGGDTGAPFPSAIVIFGRPANLPASAWWTRPTT